MLGESDYSTIYQMENVWRILIPPQLIDAGKMVDFENFPSNIP
jgi:hypothetical protein